MSDQPVAPGDYPVGPVLGNFNPCFAAGSRILTTHGEVAVERLAVGDGVVLADGGVSLIRWIGSRHVDCARHPRPWDVLPVRVTADAFGPGMPDAALLLSPDHAVFVAGVLIPVRYLLNGQTIRQDRQARVTYYHVELAQHAVLLAQGLPAESYLDTGNRSAFEGGGVVTLHARFAAEAASRDVWARAACARLVTDGPELVAVREALLARARKLGARLTGRGVVRLEVDGVLYAPEVEGASLTWAVPERARLARLVSRRFVPAECQADSADTRQLGVAVTEVLCDGVALDIGGPGLAQGWQAAEPGLRWTDGAGLIPVAGVAELRVVVAPLGHYWVEPREATFAAA